MNEGVFKETIQEAYTQENPLAVYDLIDRLRVSARWKDIFKRIHTVYLLNYFQGTLNNLHFWNPSPLVNQLRLGQKFNFFTSFNLWALLLGPIYYLFKFMYKKAIIIGAILYFLIVYNQFTPYFIPLIMLYCCIFANRDYFVKKVLKNHAIVNNPSILSVEIDEEYFLAVSKRKNAMPLAFIAALTILISLGYFLANSYNLELETDRALTNVPRVCSSQEECTKYINDKLQKISMSKDPKAQYSHNYKIACAYAIMGNKNNAIKFLDLTLRQNPKYLPAYLMRASYQFENQNYQQALVNYNMALAIAPRAKFIHYYIGRTYYRTRDYKNALIHLEIATKVKRNDPIALETLAYTKIYLKDFDGAIKDLRRTIDLYERQDSKKNAVKIKSIERYVKSLEERI